LLIFSQHSKLIPDWWHCISNHLSYITHDMHYPYEYMDRVTNRSQVHWELPPEGVYKINVDGLYD